MRETHNIDKCDNDQCSGVIIDERKSIWKPFLYFRFDGSRSGYMASKTQRKNCLPNADIIVCSEECLIVYIQKQYKQVMMEVLKS